MENIEENLVNQDLPKKKIKPLYFLIGGILFLSFIINIFFLYFYFNVYAETKSQLIDSERRLVASNDRSELLFNSLQKPSDTQPSLGSPSLVSSPSPIVEQSLSPEVVSFSEEYEDLMFSSSLGKLANENINDDISIYFKTNSKESTFKRSEDLVKVFIRNNTDNTILLSGIIPRFYKYNGVWERLAKNGQCGVSVPQSSGSIGLTPGEEKEITAWWEVSSYCSNKQDIKINMPTGEYKVVVALFDGSNSYSTVFKVIE